MATKEEIIARLTELIQPLLQAQGLELVDIEFMRGRRGRSVLRLFLDRPGGIGLEDITRMSRVVGKLLDVHDLIPESYNLEVSSPGLTRPLKKPADYQRFAGRLARITTRAPYEGRQVHSGILQGLEGDNVRLEEDGQLYEIPLAEIARARLEIDWKNLGKEG